MAPVRAVDLRQVRHVLLEAGHVEPGGLVDRFGAAGLAVGALVWPWARWSGATAWKPASAMRMPIPSVSTNRWVIPVMARIIARSGPRRQPHSLARSPARPLAVFPRDSL